MVYDRRDLKPTVCVDDQHRRRSRDLARGYRAFACYSADRHTIIGAARGIDGLYLATAWPS